MRGKDKLKEGDLKYLIECDFQYEKIRLMGEVESFFVCEMF